MKITNNAINNYNLHPTNNANNIQQTLSKTKELNVLSKKEKNFFAGLYPKNKNEIINYHFYNSKAKMSGITKGSKIDRRI